MKLMSLFLSETDFSLAVIKMMTLFLSCCSGFSHLWTRCQKRSCCGFYPGSLLPVRTGTARLLSQAVPGQSRPVPGQSRADSPLRYPGSEKRS